VEQELSDFELIIHDNASVDGTQAALREWVAREPRFRLHESGANLGYSAGHNPAILAARGDYVVLMNQDVELDRRFLSAIVAAFEAHPEVASVQPRLRQLANGRRLDTLDTTGLVMGRDRRAVSRAQGLLDGPDHQRRGYVWGADGPAPAYRVAALRDAALPRGDGTWEVLDEDFFMYKEDVDIAWRLRLMGWSARYEPAALGWHARGTGATGATSALDIARANLRLSSTAKKLSWTNQRLMQIKNEEPRAYLRDLPWIAGREILSFAFILLFDVRRLSSLPSLYRLAPRVLRKRRVLWSRLAARRDTDA
jgi:GT2 family glycosyltransferase